MRCKVVMIGSQAGLEQEINRVLADHPDVVDFQLMPESMSGIRQLLLKFAGPANREDEYTGPYGR